jgi:hypothetical protein
MTDPSAGGSLVEADRVRVRVMCGAIAPKGHLTLALSPSGGKGSGKLRFSEEGENEREVVVVSGQGDCKLGGRFLV